MEATRVDLLLLETGNARVEQVWLKLQKRCQWWINWNRGRRWREGRFMDVFFFRIVWKIIKASFDKRRVWTSLLAHRGLLRMIHTEVTSIKYICDLFAFLCIMRMHRFLAICLNEKRSRTRDICILIFIATLFSLLFFTAYSLWYFTIFSSVHLHWRYIVKEFIF